MSFEGKLEELPIPGMTPKSGAASVDLKDYSVKYYKANLDEPSDTTHLQDIETRGIRGDGIVVLTREKFTFMDKFFLVIQYMEKNL